MATRKSTPKWEVVTTDTGVVVHSRISKTDAVSFARDMNRGGRQSVIARPIRSAQLLAA